jgi:hypothetical protein
LPSCPSTEEVVVRLSHSIIPNPVPSDEKRK